MKRIDNSDVVVKRPHGETNDLAFVVPGAQRERVHEIIEGIVATSVAPGSQVRGFRYFHGGHPTPNADSIQAASTILKALNAQNAASLVIFMISGGGSSIVDRPIDDEISLDDLIATYRALVLSGAPIAEINAIRKACAALNSTLKIQIVEG